MERIVSLPLHALIRATHKGWRYRVPPARFRSQNARNQHHAAVEEILNR